MVQKEPTEAIVEGNLPAWLHGSLVRNGPGTFKGMKHLFDGYAMLVKVSFKDGRANVQQRQASPNVTPVGSAGLPGLNMVTIVDGHSPML